MKVYKVVWSEVDHKNSLESLGMAIPSNYRNPRIERQNFYSTRELAEERMSQIKDASNILGNLSINVWIEEIEVKESL